MKKKLSQDEIFDILARGGMVGFPTLEDDDMTISRYAEKYKLPYRTAGDQLDRAVIAGVLTKEKVASGGRLVYRYIQVNGTNNGASKAGRRKSKRNR